MATINLPGFQWPASSTEYVLAMAAYLIGIFIVASIIGEISNIVAAANSQKVAFQRSWDHLKECMRIWKIPPELQNRVQVWHDYACSQQLMLDEKKVLDFLPTKMKSDVAIHVHLDVLSKVTLFQDCEKTLLRELVLKLRPALFVPGDYICKKGEIGKEMYIVNQGIVQVLGGVTGSQVLAELGPGSVFGEISLLAVGGGNRRTAHVRSKGFSTLLLLNKMDLHETLVDYPDAQETLKKKARCYLRRDKKREHHQSQGSKIGGAPDQGTSSIHNNRVAKAAVMALTSAAKAARERAAVAKLKEEKQSTRNADVGQTSATVPLEGAAITNGSQVSVGRTKQAKGSLTSVREAASPHVGSMGNAVPLIMVTGDSVPLNVEGAGSSIPLVRCAARESSRPKSVGNRGGGIGDQGGSGSVPSSVLGSRPLSPQITISSLAMRPLAHAHNNEQDSTATVMENLGLSYTPLMPVRLKTPPTELPHQCSDEATSDT